MHSTTGKTPFSILKNERPNLKNIRVFGCKAYVLRLPRISKLEPRAIEGVYLETIEFGVYRVLVKSDTGLYRLVDSRHVTFDESDFPGS